MPRSGRFGCQKDVDGPVGAIHPPRRSLAANGSAQDGSWGCCDAHHAPHFNFVALTTRRPARPASLRPDRGPSTSSAAEYLDVSAASGRHPPEAGLPAGRPVWEPCSPGLATGAADAGVAGVISISCMPATTRSWELDAPGFRGVPWALLYVSPFCRRPHRLAWGLKRSAPCFHRRASSSHR